MSAGRICSRRVVTAWPGESVRAAARRMQEKEVGILVVLKGEQAGQPVGIVTDRDIALRCVAAGLDPETTPVSRIMTQPIRAIDEGMEIENALRRMAEAGTRRLAVTGFEGKLVGILSLDDVLELLLGEAGSIAKLLGAQVRHVAA